MIRPAEHLVFDGGAFVDERVCALRQRVRGQDAELDQTLLAIRLAGLRFSERSSTGTLCAPRPEPVSESTRQQLDNTVSTTTAAGLLGISDRAVRKAITEKRLPASSVEGRWRIDRHEVERYRLQRRECA
jgi:excisionase family DNA binding protein